MGLRRVTPHTPHTEHAYATRQRRVRTLAATLVVVALTCGAGYRTATADGRRDAKRRSSSMCTKYGAKGDGHHNDSQALQHAITAAAAHPGSTVYLPRGAYYCPTRDPADQSREPAGRRHVRLVARGTSRLRLALHHQQAQDRRRRGQRRRESGGRHPHHLQRLRFRGGGGSGSNGAVVWLGSCSGSSRSLSHVTFSHCQIERNLGVENFSVNGGSGRDFNDISVYENPAAGGSQVSYLTFVGCHVGVSNGAGGHDTGSPRAGIEVWTGHGKSR